MTAPDTIQVSASTGGGAPDSSASLQLHAYPIKLVRTALRHLEYRELRPESPIRDLLNQPVNISISFEAGVRIAPEGAELQMTAVVSPDVEFIPIQLTVKMSAFFTREASVTDENLKEFAAGSAVRMLYPYLRELVSSVTSRGLYAPVWLDPIQAQILVDQIKKP